MKILFNYKKKKISLEVRKIPKIFEGIGLMFSSKNTKPVLFSFKKSIKLKIHSYFVFYKFLALWFDEDMKLIDKKIIKPFQLGISPSRKFKYLVEIPFNSNSDEVLKFLVGQERFK
ncbi:MAG: hypothetical protein U9R00_03040 [Patescibacteria group bacterium]|nr:hypothetical protein [Patescibacteria group bacterium]